MKNTSFMKISELSELTGVPTSTIRYYLREGLLHPPVKTGKTMAYYDDGHVKQLELIKEIKDGENRLFDFSAIERVADERDTLIEVENDTR